MADKVIQMGYMSGDTYTAAAWLALDASHRVIVVTDTREADDRTGQIIGFYRECGLDGQVIQFTTTAGTGARALFNDVKDLYNGRTPAPVAIDLKGRAPGSLPEWRSVLYHQAGPRQWPRSITAVTGLFANAFDADPDDTLATVARTFKAATLPTDMKFALYLYMAGKFKKVGYQARPNIVVLWSRQSGKKGAAHLEMDTSYAEIRQLARHFCTRATVLLVGDERKGKLATLATEDAHIINLSEMWNDPFWNANFGGAKVLAQLALFAVFHQNEHKVIHYGHRSGMLECMALLGMDTFYLEPAACPSGGRMTAFQGAGIPYTRIQIDGVNLPGITARGAQLEIERRVRNDEVPVVSKDTYDRLRRQTGNALAHNNEAFQIKHGSYWHRKAGKWVPTEEAKADASTVAKLALGGVPWAEDRGFTMANQPELYRGFLPADLERITGIIEARFRV